MQSLVVDDAGEEHKEEDRSGGAGDEGDDGRGDTAHDAAAEDSSTSVFIFVSSPIAGNNALLHSSRIIFFRVQATTPQVSQHTKTNLGHADCCNKKRF